MFQNLTKSKFGILSKDAGEALGGTTIDRIVSRKSCIRLCIKGNAVIKTFIKGTGRAQRGNVLKS